ncbi:MAG: hypothetical protein RL014_1601 [Pseudomonadota bacterium]|jgi:uncharacterized protein (TIGR00369 family)
MSTAPFQPRFEGYEARTRDSFALQGVMHTLGARMGAVAPGSVEILVDWAPGLTQQNGFLHGGVVATVLDSACGYAAFTLMPQDTGVLTIEFKTNFVAPAQGQRFRAVGQVIKPGRTISLVDGRAYALAADGSERLVATMTATLMAVTGRSDTPS